MAVINLKEEKRIITNGNVDKVVTQLNNEPIFRQNGYQLNLDSTNSDYISFTNNYDIPDGGYLEIDFEFKNIASNKYILGGSTSNTNSSIQIGTGLILRGVSGRIDWGGFASGNERILFRIERTGTTYELFKNGLSLGNGTVQGSVPNSFAFNLFNRAVNFYFSNTVYSIDFNGVKYKFENINSNAQIFGTNGDLGTVLTSQASGITYILGTVFQKSSFALSFDNANSEYLELPNEPEITSNYEISFTYNETSNCFIAYGKTTGSYLLIGSNGSFGVRMGSTTSNNVYPSGTFVSGGRYNIKIRVDSGTAYYSLDGGAEVARAYTGVFNLEENPRNTSTAPSYYQLQYLKYNDIEYLKEGLGNTTNGATINTSHADGIKRINFGMWQKGNSADGWTPYTVV